MDIDRSPLAPPIEARRSRTCLFSSGEIWTSYAPRFCSRYWTLLVLGIGKKSLPCNKNPREDDLSRGAALLHGQVLEDPDEFKILGKSSRR